MMYIKPYSLRSIVRFFALMLLFFFPWRKIYAQEKDRTQEIIEKIRLYGMKQTKSILFIHYDKTIYLPRENIWFAGYLLEQAGELYQPDELTIALVMDNSKKYLFKEKFAVINGFAAGTFSLPDTLTGGKYSLIAFTNRMKNGLPDDIFTQPILIKTSSVPEVNLTLRLIGDHENMSKYFELKVKDKKSLAITDTRVNYWIGENKFEGKTNNEGLLNIPLDNANFKPGDSILRVSVKYHENVQNITGVFHLPPKSLIVRFYPEGGNLIHATSTWIGWQTETVDHAPVSKIAYLYKDNVCIDTIQTDRLGLGRFKLIPIYNSRYTIRFSNAESDNSTFTLPPILQRGPAISISKAIVNDTLKFRLTSKYPQRVIVFIHNYREVFSSFTANLNPAGKNFVLNLDNIPKGVSAVTVLDSTFKPWAERLFFAHYNLRPKLDIQTIKDTYLKREKIKVHLSVGDKDTAIVSIACVQKSRLESRLCNDIATYFYLTNEIGNVSSASLTGNTASGGSEYLENLLLIKGWRRYNWQDAIQTTPRDTSPHQSLIYLTGDVLKQNKPLKEPIRIVLASETETSTISTRQDGSFTLNNSGIVSDKKIRLMPMGNASFKIKINDNYDSLARSIVSRLKIPPLNFDDHNSEDDDIFLMKGIEHNILLKEVKIKSTRSATGNKEVYGGRTTNNCGDYVCKYGILNCANHSSDAGNQPPIRGKMYHVQKGNQIVDEIYPGCTGDENESTQQIFLLKGISFSKEFYGSDYSVINPSEPEYFSTIFWKSKILLSVEHPSEFEFYASDATGPFKIIVQGISKGNVVYSEKEINIK